MGIEDWAYFYLHKMKEINFKLPHPSEILSTTIPSAIGWARKKMAVKKAYKKISMCLPTALGGEKSLKYNES